MRSFLIGGAAVGWETLLGNDESTRLSKLPRTLEVGGKFKVQLGDAQVVILNEVALVRHRGAYHAICQVKYNWQLVDGGWTC